jgi:putative transposase
MKKTRFTEAQIVPALKNHESGIPVKEICRKLTVSYVTFYKWKSKYGGYEASDVTRLKDLDEENSRLKRMFAELSMDHSILKDVISKKDWGPASKGNCGVHC